MGNDEKKSQSWWSTIPGTITAIATLITAVGGLIVILQSLGVFKHSQTPHRDSTAYHDPKPAPSAIHSESKLVIRFPYSYDLDAGVAYRTEGNAADVDFIWEHPTSMEYVIRPDLGKFSLLGKQNFDGVDLAQLEKLQYSKETISADLLLKGVVVAVITKEKRFGKFIVEDESSFEPTFRVVIYEREQ